MRATTCYLFHSFLAVWDGLVYAFLFILARQQGVGFSPNRYVSETYWRDNVLEILNDDALQVWEAALMQINQISKTTVKKIHTENRRMWREAFHSQT